MSTAQLPTPQAYRWREVLWTLKRRLKNCRRIDYDLSLPFISGDAFRHFADFVFDENGLAFLPHEVFPGGIVFVRAEPAYIDYFFRELHSRIRHEYVLVTHNGDGHVPGDQIDRLDDPKLLAWFSTNATTPHEKLVSIPIGLLNHRHNESNALRLAETMATPPTKKRDLYMNFHIGGERERPAYRAMRQRVFDTLASFPDITIESRVPIDQYRHSLASHRFVVSPPGHGPDCYRHWEAMYLQTIPIVEAGTHTSAFSDFPLLLVDNWHDVTPERIATFDHLERLRTFDRSRLDFRYWKNQIRDAVSPVRTRPLRPLPRPLASLDSVSLSTE